MNRYNVISTLERQIKRKENRVRDIVVLVERLVIILQFIKKL